MRPALCVASARRVPPQTRGGARVNCLSRDGVSLVGHTDWVGPTSTVCVSNHHEEVSRGLERIVRLAVPVSRECRLARLEGDLAGWMRPHDFVPGIVDDWSKWLACWLSCWLCVEARAAPSKSSSWQNGSERGLLLLGRVQGAGQLYMYRPHPRAITSPFPRFRECVASLPTAFACAAPSHPFPCHLFPLPYHRRPITSHPRAGLFHFWVAFRQATRPLSPRQSTAYGNLIRAI